MRFYDLDGGASVTPRTSPHGAPTEAEITVVLPTMSTGSVPQLALDLFSHQSYLHLPARWAKMGYLESPYVHPIAGVEEKPGKKSDAFELSLALEVYHLASSPYYVIQQRAPVRQGYQRAFARDMVQWCTATLGATRLIVLSSADAAFRKIDEATSTTDPLYTFSSSSGSAAPDSELDTKAAEVDHDLFEDIAVPYVINSAHLDAESLPGSTALLRYYFREVAAATTRSLSETGATQRPNKPNESRSERHDINNRKRPHIHALLSFIYPGHDNLKDATKMADALWRFAMAADSGASRIEETPTNVKKMSSVASWQQPQSWDLLYGQPVDPLIYQ